MMAASSASPFAGLLRLCALHPTDRATQLAFTTHVTSLRGAHSLSRALKHLVLAMLDDAMASCSGGHVDPVQHAESVRRQMESDVGRRLVGATVGHLLLQINKSAIATAADDFASAISWLDFAELGVNANALTASDATEPPACASACDAKTTGPRQGKAVVAAVWCY